MFFFLFFFFFYYFLFLFYRIPNDVYMALSLELVHNVLFLLAIYFNKRLIAMKMLCHLKSHSDASFDGDGDGDSVVTKRQHAGER